MPKIKNGDLLWSPSPESITKANLTDYIKWLSAHKNLHFDSYKPLWTWSVEQLPEFWESLFTYFELAYSQDWTEVLTERSMPYAHWFPGRALR